MPSNILTLFNICESSGILRTFYILKIFITITSILVPIIIVIKTSTSLFIVITDGKSESMRNILIQSLKNICAGLIVFFLPSLINFTFLSLVNYTGTELLACYTNATIDKIKELEATEMESAKEKTEKDPISVGDVVLRPNENSGSDLNVDDIQNLKTYSNLKILKTITEDKMYDKVIIKGHDGLSAAQSMTVIDDYIITAQVNASKNNKTLFQVLNKNTLKKENEFYGSFVHAGGMTYNATTNQVTISHGHGTKDISTFTIKNLTGNTKITNKNTIHLNRVGTGMAYDNINNVYLSNTKSNIHVYDKDFNYLRSISLKRKYACQDMAVHSGIAIVPQYQHNDSSQPRNGLDFYRVSDGAYLGSYNLPSTRLEIESIDYSGEGNKFYIFFGVVGKKDELYSIDIDWNDFK